MDRVEHQTSPWTRRRICPSVTCRVSPRSPTAQVVSTRLGTAVVPVDLVKVIKLEAVATMLNVLSKIPVQSHKAAAENLKGLAVVGALFAFLSLLWPETTGKVAFWDRLPYILFAVGAVIAAGVFAIASWQLSTMQGRFKKYSAILTGVEAISIQRVAEITRSRPSRVREEIQSMLDSNMIDDLYIDYSADQVVSKRYTPKTSHKTVVKCSECGGNNELIVGITKFCSFCGQPLLLGRPQATSGE